MKVYKNIQFFPKILFLIFQTIQHNYLVARFHKMFCNTVDPGSPPAKIMPQMDLSSQSLKGSLNRACLCSTGRSATLHLDKTMLGWLKGFSAWLEF